MNRTPKRIKSPSTLLCNIIGMKMKWVGTLKQRIFSVVGVFKEKAVILQSRIDLVILVSSKDQSVHSVKLFYFVRKETESFTILERVTPMASYSSTRISEKY